ncbi:unnamed protein product [Mytilus edulis]|uniref:Uncharacterized protein n=1 Tax=Mytilus edulis TaxID=6550 RepID=A0A8S3S9F8_MYTED|nr:unnamed protein product [Mytilus edulis]
MPTFFNEIRTPLEMYAAWSMVEATSTHQRLQSTPLPSPAGSSGTDPNLNTFVPVVEIITDDHEEITKPVHVDQTTVDEISKPSSEKTTMKTSISSQQYGSTSTQHNVSSEPTGIDSENISPNLQALDILGDPNDHVEEVNKIDLNCDNLKVHKRVMDQLNNNDDIGSIADTLKYSSGDIDLIEMNTCDNQIIICGLQ